MEKGSCSTQQPELPLKVPSPSWPAPVHLASTCFSQFCLGPTSPQVCGPHQGPHTERSKERYWGMVLSMSDLEPAVASLRDSCFLIFVFTLNSHLPAYYDWWTDLGNPRGTWFPSSQCRPKQSAFSFLLLLLDLSLSLCLFCLLEGLPSTWPIGVGCPLPQCTPLPKWSIIIPLFLNGLPREVFAP